MAYGQKNVSAVRWEQGGFPSPPEATILRLTTLSPHLPLPLPGTFYARQSNRRKVPSRTLKIWGDRTFFFMMLLGGNGG